MSILYVVSDRPGAGKTALCMALTKLLRAQSKSVVVVKPVADDEDDNDAAMYAETSGHGYAGVAGLKLPKTYAAAISMKSARSSEAWLLRTTSLSWKAQMGWRGRQGGSSATTLMPAYW